jgi:hypothetical protein
MVVDDTTTSTPTIKYATDVVQDEGIIVVDITVAPSLKTRLVYIHFYQDYEKDVQELMEITCMHADILRKMGVVRPKEEDYEEEYKLELLALILTCT